MIATAEKAKPYLPVKAKTENWCTPPRVLEPVRRVFGGKIGFDPCGNPYSRVGATRQVWLPSWLVEAPEERNEKGELVDSGHPAYAASADVLVGDGLEVPWLGDVFFNPPFSHVLMGRFLERAAAMAAAGAGSAIGFVPSKTDIKAWHAHVSKAAAVCLIAGRVRHLLPDGTEGDPAPFSQALVLFTESRALVHRFALELDGVLGQVWKPA